MRVGIVGSGFAGLSAAFYLTSYEATKTVVYERATVLGGRANVVDRAEHSTPLFLDDYTHFLDILQQIPGDDGGSLHDELRPVERYWHTRSRGWVKTSSRDRLPAGELPLRDRMAIAVQRRRSPLLAARELGPETNRYGARTNLSVRTIARTVPHLVRPRTAYVFDGPTDASLLAPWVRLLEDRGVAFNVNTGIRLVRPEGSGVFVQSERGAEKFDAVVVAAFVPDMIDLLAASGIPLSARRIRHRPGSYRCLTVSLDPREHVLVDDAPALYASAGIRLVVQPRHRRCVVVVAGGHASDDDVLARVQDVLDLEYDVVDVAVRANQRPDEGLYTAGYLDPQRLLARPLPNLYFAGSYVKNSYPVDSGEGAARSALAAVRRMQSDYSLLARRR